MTTQLNRELGATLQSAKLHEALVEQNFEPGAMTPDRFARLIGDDTARWRKMILDSGLKPE